MKGTAGSSTGTPSNGENGEPMTIAHPQPLRMELGLDIEMSSLSPIEPSDSADDLRAEIITRRSSESASPREPFFGILLGSNTVTL